MANVDFDSFEKSVAVLGSAIEERKPEAIKAAKEEKQMNDAKAEAQKVRELMAQTFTLEQQIERGKKVYETDCAACHGTELKGSDKGPPLLHRIYEPSHHADAAFQLAAKNGVRAHHWKFGDMAPVPQVTPDDVAHITAYVRSEQRKVGID